MLNFILKYNTDNLVSYIYSFICALTLILIILFNYQLNNFFQIILLTFFVSLFGIPHGALDPWIAYKYKIWNTRIGLIYFNLFYIFITFVIITLWVFKPIESLILFLLISAYHFSEDWKHIFSIWERMIIGVSIISLPLIFNLDKVQYIYILLSEVNASIIAKVQFYLAITCILPLFFMIFKYIRTNKFIALELFFIILSALILDPLLYFLLYFCFLHSLKHFKKYFRNSKYKITKKATYIMFTYTLLTILLSLSSFYFLPKGEIEQNLIKILFIGLSSLTMPHMILIFYTDHKNLLNVKTS